VLAAAAYGWQQHSQPVTLPAPGGSYAVGRATYDWTDPNRPETLGPGRDGHRKLVVWIWYPAAHAASAQQAALYLPANWAQALERSRGVAGDFFTQNLTVVHPHAIVDAAVADATAPDPVVLFQPGLGPGAPDYTTLAEDLASRGYVVVASTPTYSSNTVVFHDGRVVEQTDAGTVPDSASAAEAKTRLDALVNIWAADNLFVTDQLAKMNSGELPDRLTGKLDLNAIGVMGHSFGGASAAETCRLSERCKAGVDLDGSPYGGVIQNGLRQPFMFMWSEPRPGDASAQQTEQDTEAIIKHSTAPISQLTVRGTRHFNFSDYAVLYEPVLRPMLMLGLIDGRRGLAITTAYVAAFFGRYLKGLPGSLLDGQSVDYPEVQFGAP